MLVIGVSLCVALLLFDLGCRVLVLAMKGGALPDRLVGLFFCLLGIGVPPALTAPQAALVPLEWASSPMAIGHLLLSVAFASLYLFAWTCFGHRSAWRRILALTACAALFVLWATLGVVRHFEPPGGVIIQVTALVRLGALLWAFCESVNYPQIMRRRQPLGLIDPVVANRFVLWSGWTGRIVAALILVVTVRLLMPGLDVTRPDFVTRVVMLSIAMFGTMSATCLALAFFPPRWYVVQLTGEAGV